MEILKASIFSSENYYATMTPALCKVYIFVTVCYAHVYIYTETDWGLVLIELVASLGIQSLLKSLAAARKA